jgi:hypothetical protein
MRVYVEIDETLDLFGHSDWEIDAKETIKEALYWGKLNTIPLTVEEVEFLQSMK